MSLNGKSSIVYFLKMREAIRVVKEKSSSTYNLQALDKESTPKQVQSTQIYKTRSVTKNKAEEKPISYNLRNRHSVKLEKTHLPEDNCDINDLSLDKLLEQTLQKNLQIDVSSKMSSRRQASGHSGLCCLSQPRSTNKKKFILMSAWKTLIVLISAVGFYNLYSVSIALEEIKHSLNGLSKDIVSSSESQEKLEARIVTMTKQVPYQPQSVSNGTDLYTNIKEMVKKELKLYDADKTSRSDFALESAGGRIVSIRSTRPFLLENSPISWIWNMASTAFCSTADTARPIIQPGVLPGQCWAFQGSQGAVVVRLLGNVYITGLTLEHIPASIAPTQEISSAPKLFSLWGLKTIEEPDGYFFGEFVYDKEGPAIQSFSIQYKANVPFQLVQLKIHSNWGNSGYTCVYRLRIHGRLDSKYVQKRFYDDSV